MQEDLIEQKIIVISEEPEIPPKIPTKTKTSRNSKTVKTTQTTNNPKAVYKGMDFFIYGRNCCQIFFGDLPTWSGIFGPKLHPEVDFLDHDFL